MPKPEPLFPDNTAAKSIDPLFARDNPASSLFPDTTPSERPVASLFSADTASLPPPVSPASARVAPLVMPDTSPTPTSPAPSIAPALAPEPLSAPLKAPSQSGPAPALAPEPLAAPPKANIPESAPVFAVQRDPLVERFVGLVLQAYPKEAAGHEQQYRSLLEIVLPLAHDKLLSWGEHPVQVAKGAIQHAQEMQAQIASLPVQDTLNATLQAAKFEHDRKVGTPAAHGLTGLLHKAHTMVESIESGDPRAGKASLEQMRGAINDFLLKAPTITDLSQKCAGQLAALARCASVLTDHTQDGSLKMACQQRSMIFLGLLQQIQIAEKQVEQQVALQQNALSQIDQALNVTLPALGIF